MARVTVEDCVEKIPNRFELVLLAAQRARNLSRGEEMTLDRDDDSATFAMALLGGCGGTELICRNSGFTSANLTFTKSALPAGTYVLLVTGGSQNPAGFSLNATLSP